MSASRAGRDQPIVKKWAMTDGLDGVAEPEPRPGLREHAHRWCCRPTSVAAMATNSHGACRRGEATITQAPIPEATHHSETPAPPGEVLTASTLVKRTSSNPAACRMCSPMSSPLTVEHVTNPHSGRSVVRVTLWATPDAVALRRAPHGSWWARALANRHTAAAVERLRLSARPWIEMATR